MLYQIIFIIRYLFSGVTSTKKKKKGTYFYQFLNQNKLIFYLHLISQYCSVTSILKMSRIIVHQDTIIISSETCFLHQSIGGNDFKYIDLSKELSTLTNEKEPENSNKPTNEKAFDKDVKINFVCVAISSNNLLLAIQTPEKKLFVFKIQNWDIIYERQLARGASKIIFTPDNNNVIVGDKTGDVFLYELYSDKKELLLLGHLSIVLDILMTDDSKHIITCDRDEKIRVSNYPNCYNIESYCLGHEQFVTNVQLLPHNKKLLISCSGDGTLRLWDYLQGSVKNIYEFKNEKDDATESQNQLKCFTSAKLTDTTSIVCVTIFKSNTLHVLLVKNETFEIINSVNLGYEPVHLQLCCYTSQSNDFENGQEKEEMILWLVGPSELQVLKWDGAETTFNNVTNSSILYTQNNLNKYFKELAIEDSNVENVIYVLQKRKMDEITDYFERKKARIEEKVQKSQKKKLAE